MMMMMMMIVRVMSWADARHQGDLLLLLTRQHQGILNE
jgi:hypothetical protein